MPKHFSTYFDFLEKQNKRTRLVSSFFVFALLLFFALAITLPLGNSLLNQLFLKIPSHGAGLVADAESESGTITGNATIISDPVASGGKYVRFGSVGTDTGTFQPSAPYYATFFYLWYKNPAIDGNWSYWNDHNSPPTTWFSHYIPDLNPQAFDPANELYSTNSYATFQWQVSKMAEAHLEVSIASWWGQGRKEDVAFNKIVNEYMKQSDNPYPNLRWTIYYEKEAINPATNASPNNPSVSEIVSDLTYIKNSYAQSPYFLKVNGKPVIFVYGDGSDNPGTVTQRWKDANTQLGNYFYLVLKVFSGFATDPNQPDSWHQYSPALRVDAQGAYSFAVSPGFWLDDPGINTNDAVRLCRNLNGPAQSNCGVDNPGSTISFQQAVTNMVSSNAKWKLITTWNEWGEGTSVEPGLQTMKDSTGKEVIDPTGAAFGNGYVDVLKNILPPLEQGIGVGASAPTPTPTQTTAGTDPVVVAAGDIACGTGSGGASCKQMETSNLFVGTTLNPDAVLALGDIQYEAGDLADYNNFFDPSWGRVINKIYPTIGNHEYTGTNTAADGTFDYFESKFGGPGNTAKRPGARGQGYYSFDLGAWHLISLNSNCSKAGGCQSGSPQEAWLRQDLAAHTNTCVLAFFHHPWWSSGGRAQEGAVLPLLQALYDNNADVLLAGHDHTYERFAPQDPNGNADATRGMREFVVGTGGRNHTTLAALTPNSEKFDSTTFGVIKMTLHPTSYDWQFIPANFSGNGTFTDSGSGQGCH